MLSAGLKIGFTLIFYFVSDMKRASVRANALRL